MEKSFKIKISKPCNENWEKMVPNDIGRFCNACEKTVIDFREMTDLEVAIFFKYNKSRICGNYTKSQLSKSYTYLEPKKSSPVKQYVAILLAGMAVLPTFLAAQTQTTAEVNNVEITTSNGSPLQALTTENNKTVLGRVVYYETKQPASNLLVDILIYYEEWLSIGGVVTDENGYFEITVPKGYQERTAIISINFKNGIIRDSEGKDTKERRRLDVSDYKTGDSQADAAFFFSYAVKEIRYDEGDSIMGDSDGVPEMFDVDPELPEGEQIDY